MAVHPKWRRRIAFMVLVALIAAALLVGFWPRPQAVETAVVRRGPLRITVQDEGQTRVIDRFVISAPVAGFAERLRLDVGDAVAKGQTLLELEALRPTVLDPRSRAEAEARVAAAQAELKAAEQAVQAARAEAELARTALERLRNLHRAQGVSQEELDQAAARARSTAANQRSAVFNVDVARYRLQAARTALAYSAAHATDQSSERVAVASPVAGRVLKIYRKSEGVVGAGEPLLEVGDPRALEVAVDVLSADAVRIRPGMRVLFERWGGGPPLEGRVRRVEPVGFTKVSALGVEEQRVWVISDIVSNVLRWERLGDGYRVEASFILWDGTDVLQVPTSALFRVGDRWAAFVVEDGRARRRIVEVGRRNGLAAQVNGGLVAGQSVITHPDDTIEDGTRVEASSHG